MRNIANIGIIYWLDAVKAVTCWKLRWNRFRKMSLGCLKVLEKSLILFPPKTMATLDTKVQLLQALVWPVATYRCKSWTVKRADEHRLEAFEMTALRQILRVLWTAKKTNSWVLERAGVHRGLLANVKSRNLKYFGHTVHVEDKSLEKSVIQGTLPGSRTRERPKTAWIDNVTLWTGLKLEDAIRNVDNRSEWIHSAAYHQIEDG